MADLMGGRGPATSNGNGSASARPTTARAAVGSPSGIRGPRVIMQERAAREAARERQREEAERLKLEQDHLENEARLADEALRRRQEQKEAERRDAAAAAAAAGAGTFGAGTGAGAGAAPIDPTTSRRPAQQQRTAADNGARSSRHIPPIGGLPPPRNAPRVTTAPQPIPGMAGPSGTQPPPPQLTESSTALGRGRNSFPHAFERWETLSAHWEGLTSFWIRRLEQSAQEIGQDPISSQLSRQVTDLSSAGANLFHAVVELQRLRASSERKFQRWFFETRADVERSQEVTHMLEQALQEERRSRADAIRDAIEQEQGSSKLHKQIAELRKELTISKEEARRAWEELGRREQEERDRTMSLQLGQPTIVGGVQVVPMTQGVGRGSTQRGAYAQPESADYASSPTSPSAARAQYTQAPAVKSTPAPAGGDPSFQTPSSVHHQQSYGSEGTYSEGQYNKAMVTHGSSTSAFARDDYQRSLHDTLSIHSSMHSSGDSDFDAEEFETPATQPAVYQPTGSGTQQQPQQQQGQGQQQQQGPDYSGSGYSAPWDDLGPRHHHPTRLSDVLEEEEERSRTSASQSQVSRP